MNVAANKSAPDGQKYTEWKDWPPEEFGLCAKALSVYYASELKQSRRKFPSGSHVLELGFGNGSFLGYARAQEWQVVGTELNPKLVNLAKRNGFEAVLAPDASTFEGRQFDLIVAFDVLEHIPREMLMSFLTSIKSVLAPGGVVFARFPNGDSPFSLAIQNGDITHVTAIGSGIVEYFATALNLQLVFVGGQASPIWGFGIPSLIQRLLNNFVRAIIQFFVGKLFFRQIRAFASPNLVMVLAASGIRFENQN